MKKIPKSSLILSSEGQIYHLGIKPCEIAPTIITVGDPSRVAKVSRYFDKIDFQHQNREFLLHTGTYQGKKISVLSTGIGTDNIDIVFNELDALVNIDFETRQPKKEKTVLTIMRLGTSGAICEDIPLETFIVSTQAIDLTGLFSFYHIDASEKEKNILSEFLIHMQKNLPNLPVNIFSGDPSLIQMFAQDSKVQLGITVTCNGFYGPQGRYLRTQLEHPEMIKYLKTFQYKKQRITNFDMETAGIYGFGKILGHRCCSLSVIIANRAQKTFTHDVKKAEDALIQFALNKLAKLQ